MASRRVLLTGASGFIAANVLRYLLDWTDWSFCCPASWRHKGDPQRLWDLYEANRDRVAVPTLDLTAPLADLGEFDYILNLASESHVDRSITDPVHFVENNVSLMLQVLEYARDHRPELFLQFSTDETYGPAEPGEIRTEGAPPAPSSPYAASKACQEMICQSYWQTFDVPVIITNSSNVIGPGQDAEKFLPRVIDAVVLGEEVIVHQHKGVTGTRVWNPVENVASALLFILNRPSHAYPPRYHLSGGEWMSNLELAGLVAQTLGRELRYRMVEVGDLRPGYDTHYAMLSGRLEELGWEPPTTVEKTLKEMLT